MEEPSLLRYIHPSHKAFAKYEKFTFFVDYIFQFTINIKKKYSYLLLMFRTFYKCFPMCPIKILPFCILDIPS